MGNETDFKVGSNNKLILVDMQQVNMGDSKSTMYSAEACQRMHCEQQVRT